MYQFFLSISLAFILGFNCSMIVEFHFDYLTGREEEKPSIGFNFFLLFFGAFMLLGLYLVDLWQGRVARREDED